MKPCAGVLVACVVSFLVACGGGTAAVSEAPLGKAESALVSCSTECASGLQLGCLGETCSASNGAYVECDGEYRSCEQVPPQPDPECLWLANHCENSAGTSCPVLNATRKCCLDGQLTGDCFCSPDLWACSVRVR